MTTELPTIKTFDLQGHFTKSQAAQILGISENSITKIYSGGEEYWSAFTSVEVTIQDTPKFKVGDPVYLPNQAGGKILKIQDNKACHYPFFVENLVNNSLYEIDRRGEIKYGNFTDVAIEATPENYELLCKLYPHIEFEQPSKEFIQAIKLEGESQSHNR